MIKERDNYECQICSSKENIEAHHIESIYNNPIESLDLDNGVTLCKECHRQKIHKDINCSTYDLRKDNICKNKLGN